MVFPSQIWPTTLWFNGFEFPKDSSYQIVPSLRWSFIIHPDGIRKFQTLKGRSSSSFSVDQAGELSPEGLRGMFALQREMCHLLLYYDYYSYYVIVILCGVQSAACSSAAAGLDNVLFRKRL
jgi:hypothetical protein